MDIFLLCFKFSLKETMINYKIFSLSSASLHNIYQMLTNLDFNFLEFLMSKKSISSLNFLR